RYAEAIDMYRQCIELARKLGDRGTQAIISSNLAYTLNQSGHPGAARGCYMEALQLAQETGYGALELHISRSLSTVAEACGDTAAALRHAEDALLLARALRNSEQVGRSLCVRAVALVRLNRVQEAAADWRAGMALIADRPN